MKTKIIKPRWKKCYLWSYVPAWRMMFDCTVPGLRLPLKWDDPIC